MRVGDDGEVGCWLGGWLVAVDDDNGRVPVSGCGKMMNR